MKIGDQGWVIADDQTIVSRAVFSKPGNAWRAFMFGRHASQLQHEENGYRAVRIRIEEVKHEPA